ncbi:hypothetical protein [Halalkalibacter sp. APA_J-10(15)]|uniref:hypothetical protein n=1 Tax=Halalkalibacter sp. APA_J-10(15) TaxID=2933805 RepID=UPI001FF34334|nr:hypothetical protein [Halalkalibacter sp. APA_J-10(15)]MCK0473912.1 hypothetical protein [Halalkalibacter sp. APA_J-10(15)]
MRLFEVLTDKELDEVIRLKKGLLSAKTRKDIVFYDKEINKILNYARARYYVTKEINHSEETVVIDDL